jgi:hypothetical protein
MICDTGLLATCEINNVLDSRSTNADNERVQSRSGNQTPVGHSGAPISSHMGFIQFTNPTVHVGVHTYSPVWRAQ